MNHSLLSRSVRLSMGVNGLNNKIIFYYCFCSLMQSSFTTVYSICKRAALLRSGKSFVTGFESRTILTSVIMRTTVSVYNLGTYRLRYIGVAPIYVYVA